VGKHGCADPRSDGQQHPCCYWAARWMDASIGTGLIVQRQLHFTCSVFRCGDLSILAGGWLVAGKVANAWLVAWVSVYQYLFIVASPLRFSKQNLQDDLVFCQLASG
jgi:hypothetical protein